MRKIILLTIFSLYLLASSGVRAAVNIPSFPSCAEPSGNLVASYDDGIHGIVGSAAEYRGSDKVYQIDGNSILVQCFCPSEGSGIQTNWTKVSEITQEEIDYYRNLGWHYVADGSLWGLDPSMYLAKNESFSCISGGGSSAGSGQITSSAASTNSSGSVLGLAGTGNWEAIMEYVGFGIAFLALSFVVKKYRV